MIHPQRAHSDTEPSRTGTSQINVSTRGGSNQFHGVLFEFLRNSEFDAKNFFDSPTRPIPPFTRNQFGFTASGGPSSYRKSSTAKTSSSEDEPSSSVHRAYRRDALTTIEGIRWLPYQCDTAERVPG
jgi:hypothetical protein